MKVKQKNSEIKIITITLPEEYSQFSLHLCITLIESVEYNKSVFAFHFTVVELG